MLSKKNAVHRVQPKTEILLHSTLPTCFGTSTVLIVNVDHIDINFLLLSFILYHIHPVCTTMGTKFHQSFDFGTACRTLIAHTYLPRALNELCLDSLISCGVFSVSVISNWWCSLGLASNNTTQGNRGRGVSSAASGVTQHSSTVSTLPYRCFSRCPTRSLAE